ncbi:ATP-binding protein [Streptomyces rapamycinicus]|uniref:ATP-binding protein n=2 Tax=Streptomyces rhizosphaericus TaxID=114699 RepID=A0A6G4ABP4_9ACTN|nr:ATP-binding protein [Streptomyces rhizosphaericus]
MTTATTIRPTATGRNLSEEAEYVCLCPVFPAPEAVGVIRRLARTFLAAWNLPSDLADDAVLIISELVTNAVVHACPPAVLRVSWTWSDDRRRVIHIEVTDSGPITGPRPSPDHLSPEEHGRGTDIAIALSARHGTCTRPGRITRWVDLSAA